MNRLLATLAIVFGAAAHDARAQTTDAQSLPAAAIADLAGYYQRADRRELRPLVGTPEVRLFGPVSSYRINDMPGIALCSMSVLSMNYYAPPGDGRAPSHVVPTRSLNYVSEERVFRIPVDPAACDSEDPTRLWFRAPKESSNTDVLLRIVSLTLGLIEASKSGAPTYEGVDMRAFEQATTAEALQALREEHPQRIGRVSYSTCTPDEESYCQRAQVEFGSLGPLTQVTLTTRRSLPRGERTWIEGPTVQNTFSAIP